MSISTLFSSFRNKRRRYRSQSLRRLVLLWRLGRRHVCRVAMRATLFGGWVWFAAGSLIGFEAFDIIFGTFALAPELLPFVILGLALTWYFRGRVRRALARARAHRRIRRMKQAAKPASRARIATFIGRSAWSQGGPESDRLSGPESR
jgi:hypothetical protein